MCVYSHSEQLLKSLCFIHSTLTYQFHLTEQRCSGVWFCSFWWVSASVYYCSTTAVLLLQDTLTDTTEELELQFKCLFSLTKYFRLFKPLCKNHKAVSFIITAVFSLVLGQCSLFTCQLYKYHFINQHKGWYEAQKYCREKYTDLASVYEKTDINRLQTANKQDKEVWIGLYNETVTNKTEWKWRWSQGREKYTENQTKWADGEPNNAAGSEYCVITKGSTKSWVDISCILEYRFICYNGKNIL